VRRILTIPAPLHLVLAGGLALLLGGVARNGYAQADGAAARTKGRANAPVVVYEMSDFQCPYCRDFALQTMPALEREYIAAGKVRLTYINYPLTNIHRHAVAAAELAMCAARQGKFWTMHNLLFRHQDQWAKQDDPTAYFTTLADSARLPRAPLLQCLATHATRAAVDADAAAAVRAGARSTPTFYIEGWLIDGAAPIGVFREVLDSIYKSKTAPAH